ncbi:MAG TPA: hypothetical protein VGK80_06985 [Rhodanobacteraceae bacterium]
MNPVNAEQFLNDQLPPAHRDDIPTTLQLAYAAEHRDGFIYRTPNLMALPHEVPEPFPPAEETDHEAILSLKEEIEKWQRDHGE